VKGSVLSATAPGGPFLREKDDDVANPSRKQVMRTCRPLQEPTDEPASNPPTVRLIFRPELLALVGVSYGSIFTWMRNGRFPLARELGPAGGRSSRIGWIESEVLDWIANRPKRQMKPMPKRDGGKAA
jgi:predicted DNA-binding transcriptional regulator AlpA